MKELQLLYIATGMFHNTLLLLPISLVYYTQHNVICHSIRVPLDKIKVAFGMKELCLK